MPKTILSNLPVYSDNSGHGNQRHLVYAFNQRRWWLFNTNSKTATVVSCAVSSGSDLGNATWSNSTDSPAFPTSRAMIAEQRNLGVIGFTNQSYDVVQIGVSLQSGVVVDHIRATFTGSSSISWESWLEDLQSHSNVGPAVKGHTMGRGINGKIHDGTMTYDELLQYAQFNASTNLDTGATWTNAWAGDSRSDSGAVPSNSYGIHPLNLNEMVGVYGFSSGGVMTHRYTKTSSGGAWPVGTGTGGVFAGTTTEDSNDWGSVGVSLTQVFVVRRTGAGTFDMVMFDGTSWLSKAAPPNQNHLAGSGIFLATDGTYIWMFVIDSASNGPIYWNKYTVGSDSWGSWTQLEGAGGSARNFISGHPEVANNQIGVIFTEANGSNFDLKVSQLIINPLASVQPRYDLYKFPKYLLQSKGVVA